MNNFTIIKVLDFLSFVSLTLMLSTGVFLKITLPPRSGGDEVWALTRHEWGDIHYTLSIIFLLFMSAHLVAHVKFIKKCNNWKSSSRKILSYSGWSYWANSINYPCICTRYFSSNWYSKRAAVSFAESLKHHASASIKH